MKTSDYVKDLGARIVIGGIIGSGVRILAKGLTVTPIGKVGVILIGAGIGNLTDTIMNDRLTKKAMKSYNETKDSKDSIVDVEIVKEEEA